MVGTAAPIRLAVDHRPWLPSPTTLDRMAPAMGTLQQDPRRFDGTLVALRGLRRDGGMWRGELRPVSYFHARAAESLLDAAGVRDQHRVQGRLPAIGDGPLATDLGVVVRLSTQDGQLVLQRRGLGLDWRPGMLSVSASGSLEPGPDLRGDRVDRTDLLRGAARELEEEVGISPQDGVKMRFVGVYRELARGGKPEIYVRAEVAMNADEVCDRQRTARDADEAAAVHIVPLPTSDTALASLVAELGHDADPALVASLLLDGVARGLAAHAP